MQSNDNELKSLDSRFIKWQQVASQIEQNDHLDSLLTEKIVAITPNNDGIFFEYKPSSNSQSTFFIKIDVKDLRSAGIATLSHGAYEPGVESVFTQIIRNSTYLVDIGANVGFYTCFASSLNPELRTVAFEPNPEVRERLFGNIFRNKFIDRVSVVPFGIGRSSEIANFYVPPLSGTGAGSLKELHPEEGTPLKLAIQIHPLDKVLENIPALDFIKMDIEGAEYQAILSGSRLIEKFQPVIVVELLRKWMKPFNSHPQDVVKFLSSFGYRCFAISDSGLTEITEIDETTIETNFLFYPKGRDISEISTLLKGA